MVSDTVWHRAGGGLTLLCGALAAAPDLDLLFIEHRTVTHSIGAVIFVGLFAAALAANARRPIARVALMCAAAYGSHLLLDWLGTDRYPPLGLQLLWPFSHDWYISGIDLFRQTARMRVFERGPMLTNIRAVLQEIGIVGPTVVAIYLVRVKALAGLATELPRGHHPAE
jgi:pimeloyl-ACP methyl ester carboxylesterase